MSQAFALKLGKPPMPWYLESTREIPQVFDNRLFQAVFEVLPIALTIPIPVTATRIN
jgi:hypothetical protein